VLIGATMPSVLAEVSFISNPEEEKRLKTSEYRQEIAESLLQGIKSYAETLSSLKAAN
jgi:N-acetylmuramoyl-L-alanine amidase